MTLEARVTTIESQLQQLTGTVMTLAQTNLSNASHIAGLIEATSSNTRAIESLRQVTADLAQAIAALNERMDRLEQTLEDRTNTILEMIDRQDAKITGLQADVTGLRTEMQRVIEILGEMRS